ncbi:MAG TPA: transglycosylase domain-containing protein, partial [Polyangia bacterium]|nr:transglycosylase domain-containing protein [Polyangia bacterium]
MVVVLVAVVAAAYPPVVGGLAASLFASRLSERLGRPVTVARGRGGFGQVTLRGVVIAGHPGGPPLVTAGEIAVPFGVVLGRGTAPVVISELSIHAVRGGPEDNVNEIIAHVSAGRKVAATTEPKTETTPESKTGMKIPAVAIESGRIFIHDSESGLRFETASLRGVLNPSQQLAFQLGGVVGVLALGDADKGPKFGAKELHVRAGLSGLRPVGYPNIIVKDGFATPLPSLSLTGIGGTVGPPPVGAGDKQGDAIAVDLHGSYGGARETLWTARGGANPATRQGRLALRAEQFSLGKVPDILPRSVLRPEDSNIDASFDLTWAGDAVSLGGEMAVVGLSLQHDGLSSLPIDNLSMSVNLKMTAFPATRRLQIDYIQGRVRDLVGRLSGSIELPAGTFKFADGSKLGVLPKIDLAFVVPPLSCAKLLASIPTALISNLNGFELKGTFDAKIGTKIDFSDLEALDLRGKVGIDGCKVKSAPETVTMLAGPQPILQTVEVPKAPGPKVAPGETEMLQFVVGPDNPDFVPYVQVSPHLINSIMTTEDNGFFKHRGWVASEFKSALRRNLARGGFRLGASSITMQMVKNVLLSKEKTLSRKLQELFLVWYLEQELP